VILAQLFHTVDRNTQLVPPIDQKRNKRLHQFVGTHDIEHF
jgi:hypothetical protein